MEVFGDRYWIYLTSRESSDVKMLTFFAYLSRDFKQWERSGVILDLKTIGWVKDRAPTNFGWAPAMARGDDGRYYFYYSVGLQDERRKHYSRIGVASGHAPDAYFTDSGRPLLRGDDDFEAIDPMVFKDPRSGKWYLFAGGSAGTHMKSFELAPDMVRLGRELPVRSIAGAPDGASFTEGPFMHYHEGTYFLSYSHGRWNHSDYSAHYATGPSPAGPWTYGGRILRSAGLRKGPGHHSFFRHPRTGEWFIVYHYWHNRAGDGPFDGERSIGVERVRHTGGRIELEDITGDDLPPALGNHASAPLFKGNGTVVRRTDRDDAVPGAASRR